MVMHTWMSDGLTCPTCGKITYRSRAEAKAAAKRFHTGDRRLRPYACGDGWHIGHLSDSVVAGDRSRYNYYWMDREGM